MMSEKAQPGLGSDFEGVVARFQPFQTQNTRKNAFTSEKQFSGCVTGADYWTRTNDLLITNELLYQLS